MALLFMIGNPLSPQIASPSSRGGTCANYDTLWTTYMLQHGIHGIEFVLYLVLKHFVIK